MMQATQKQKYEAEIAELVGYFFEDNPRDRFVAKTPLSLLLQSLKPSETFFLPVTNLQQAFKENQFLGGISFSKIHLEDVGVSLISEYLSLMSSIDKSIVSYILCDPENSPIDLINAKNKGITGMTLNVSCFSSAQIQFLTEMAIEIGVDLIWVCESKSELMTFLKTDAPWVGFWLGSQKEQTQKWPTVYQWLSTCPKNVKIFGFVSHDIPVSDAFYTQTRPSYVIRI
jgi:hypothetical protein